VAARPAVVLAVLNDYVELPPRVAAWKASRNFVAIGNLGEHITAHLLLSLDYQLFGAQDDYLGMVPEVLGIQTHAKPEDFIAVDPAGRLLTVNSKAAVSPRNCRITQSGNLTKPRLTQGQNTVPYSTLRANLVSPLDGDSYAQAVKVDLLHMQAQVFEIAEDGTLTAITSPYDVSAIAQDVLNTHPQDMPPPNVWDLT
jgi:hypothetical protein